MFCTKCGSRVDDGDMFCWNCGAQMKKAEKKEEVKKESSKSNKAIDNTSYSEKNKNQNIFYEASEVTMKSSAGMSIPEINREFDLSKLPSKKETGIKSFYVFDFLSRLFSKSNIPLCIYLILNIVIISLVVTLMGALPIHWGLLCGLILYIASMSIALSPIGEWMLRRQTGCHKIEEQDIIDRLYPLFKEVYYKAKMANPMISDDVRLFICDDTAPNAFATGRKTMCVTRGLLVMSDEEIKATLGHEFGHLSHKDTDRILVVSVGNTVITTGVWLFQIGAIISETFMHIVAAFTGDDEGWFISLMATISRVITLFVLNVFLKVWTKLGVLLCMKTSRNNEYEADEFSVRLGYADGLMDLLSFIGGGKPNGLFASLESSHPASTDRIAKIQALQAQLMMEE